MTRSQSLFAALAFAVCLPVAHADWPQFRGPSGDGHATGSDYPATFTEADAIWECPLPGKGWSSPVIADGTIWVTTALEVLPTEEERLQLMEAAGVEGKKIDQKQVASRVDLQVIAIDQETGKIRAEYPVIEVPDPKPIHKLNSYASPTPIIEGGQLYCHFGRYGTVCMDTTTGKPIWQREFVIEHGVGPGSSPMIHGDLLVLICDGVDRQFVVGLNKNTGETLWQTDRPEMRAASGDQKKAYSTPVVVPGVDGAADQIICMGSQWLVSYHPETGDENWRCDHGSGFSVVPRPVIGHGRVYVSTGFGKPELWAVRHDGQGDVSETHVDWKQPKRIAARPSSLLIGDEIYVVSDGGIASCFDTKTGEPHWVERIGGNYSASPVLAGGLIYFCSHEGKVTLVRPGTEFEIVSENELGSSLMASPSAIDGSLILRTETGLLRIGK